MGTSLKVLFLGVYRDGTGWGVAATRYILALDAAGVDVVCRPLKLNDSTPSLPDRILELEAKSAVGCNVVIQNILPHLMDYQGQFDLNIGLYFSETDSLRYSSWNDRLNQMDMVWGCNEQMRRAARESFVDVPFEVIPIPADIERYSRSWEPLAALRPLKEEGNFVFYTIGEMVRRKNLAGLLKAFHTEFDPQEPVSLVIKTSKPGMPPHETRRHVEAFCNEIKRGLKLYEGGKVEHYKGEVVITEHLADEDMLRLHAACDCFVQPSYGEAWSLGAFDAMAMGKTPIVTKCTGFTEYVSKQTGWLVDGVEDSVFGVDDSFIDLYTGKEIWMAVDQKELRRAMREAYEDEGHRREKAQAGIVRATDFSYLAVGTRMCQTLLEALHERRENRTGPD